jgi:TPR repeat protein
MKTFKIIFIYVCFIFLHVQQTMCQEVVDLIEPPPDNFGAYGYDQYQDSVLSDLEYEQLALEAMRGDQIAASRIVSHYFFAKNNFGLGLYWTIIETENGSIQAEADLGMYLVDWNDFFNDRTRGIFWMRVAASKGEPLSVDRLKDLRVPIYEPLPDDALYVYTEDIFTHQKISYYKDGALRGSGTAALTLAFHYRDFGSNKDEIEYWFRIGAQDESEYWFRIGAQNGNAECEYNYGLILYAKGDRLNLERGLFWLQRAASLGFTLAQMELDRLNQ